MSFVMFDNFSKYGGWPMKVVETCQRFYEKYDRYPNYIRVNEKTMNAMFDESDKAFLDPYSEEHAVRDSKGDILIPLNITKENQYEIPSELKETDKDYIDEYIETHPLDEEDFDECFYEETEYEYTEENEDEEESVYPIQFGTNDDCTVSFITNKYELKFLEGNNLPDDYYIVQFGDGPDDGGEDFEEEETDELSKKLKLAA